MMKKTKQKIQEFGCFIQLLPVSEVTKEQAHALIRTDTGMSFFDDMIEEATITIDYPLRDAIQFAVTDVWSFGELVWLIAKEYKFIYETEHKTSTIDVLPVEERGECLNRNETNGTYGIWGHEFADLRLESVTIHPGNKIELFIGS